MQHIGSQRLEENSWTYCMLGLAMALSRCYSNRGLGFSDQPMKRKTKERDALRLRPSLGCIPEPVIQSGSIPYSNDAQCASRMMVLWNSYHTPYAMLLCGVEKLVVQVFGSAPSHGDVSTTTRSSLWFSRLVLLYFGGHGGMWTS